MINLTELDILLNQLNSSGLQQKDSALFQVISQLIKSLRRIGKEFNSFDASVDNVVNNAVINNVNNSLTASLIIPSEVNSLEYFDNPYPVLNGGVVQNVVTNNNNNIINNLLLQNEYIDKEYADNPYPSLGTALPIPVAVAGNSNITDDNTTNALMFPVWVTTNSGSLPLFVSSALLSWNPGTGIFTSTRLVSSLTGIGSTIIGGGSVNGEHSLIVSNTSIGTAAFSRINIVSDAGQSIIIRSNSSGFVTSGFNTANNASISFDGSVGIVIAAIHANGTLNFYTGGSAAANERMTILANGNVGIGSTTPLQYLSVTGVGQSGASGGAIGIESTNASASVRNWVIQNSWDNFGDLTFRVSTAKAGNPLSAGISVMAMLQSGFVGIGTTSPQNLFVVSNAGAEGFEFQPSAGIIYSYNRSTVAYAPFLLYGSTVTLSIAGTPALSIAATSIASFTEGIKVNTNGTVTSSFSNGVNMGSWDAIGYDSNKLDLGGYRAAQFQEVGLYTAGTERFRVVAAGNIGIVSGAKLNFDGVIATGDTYILETSANILDLFAGGAKTLSLSATAANVTGAITATGGITSSGGGIGYTAGAGGTVTQITSRATTVILNELCGNIIMFSATQASQNIVTFTLTNSFIEANDQVFVTYIGANATNRGLWNLCAVPAAGSAVITIRNVHTGTSAAEATPLRFTIIKGAVT